MLHKKPCPSCRAKGEDRAGTNLVPFKEGDEWGWCFKCQERHKLGGEELTYQGERKPFDRPANAGFDLAAIAHLPIRAWEERGISKETMERYEVRCSVDESTGKPDALFYPYYDEEGIVTGYKKRSIPKGPFPWIGRGMGLFGKKQCKENGQFCLLVEGEHDVQAAWEMLSSLGKSYNIVSLPSGANVKQDGTATVTADMLRELPWLTKHKKIAVCLDGDAPGKAMARAIADLIVAQCEVRIVSLPRKDAGKMLEDGMAQEFYNCIGNAREHKPDQIVSGTDGGIEELTAPVGEGVHFSFLPKTSSKLGGFRPGEMTTVLAAPNVGKSSIFRQMQYCLLDETDQQVGCFFLEENIRKTKQSVVAYHAGIPLARYRKDPSLAHPDVVQDVYKNYLPRLTLFESKARTMSDDLIERKIEYMVQAKGCKNIFLDHLSFVISGREGGDERRGIDNLMTRLARSVEDLNYHLFIVSHIKRGEREQSRKDNKNRYPYWEILDMNMGRGSGAIEQLSHNILLIERQVLDPEEDNTRGLLRTRWARAREYGQIGMCDYLTMGDDGKFTPVEVTY